MNAVDTLKIVRPDSKGRINLGALTDGISGFRITLCNNNCINLEPMIEIPAREKWLFENKVALKKFKKGLEDAAQGKLVSKGDFTQYLDEEIE